MEFLNKTFGSKDELVDFVRDYCYNYGYLTIIRSSSNKRGEIFIICNCSGEEKQKDKDGDAANNDNSDGRRQPKKAKLTNCPFRVNGRRFSEEDNNEWHITIFNNTHNHLPVVDFSKKVNLNLVPPNNRSTNNTNTVYNPDLDVYEQNVPNNADNVLISSNLFGSNVIQAVNKRLTSLSRERQAIFLNRFNKLLYSEMPDYRDPSLGNVCNHHDTQQNFSNGPVIHEAPTITLNDPLSHHTANLPESQSQDHYPLPLEHTLPAIHNHDSLSDMQPIHHPLIHSNEAFGHNNPFILPAQQPQAHHQISNTQQTENPEVGRKSRICKKCGQQGHNSRTCTSHLNIQHV